MTNVLFVIRTWFKTHTYSSVSIYWNGEHIGKVEPYCQPASNAEYSAFNKLIELGYVPNLPEHMLPWRYFQENGIKYATEIVPVGKKKDL